MEMILKFTNMNMIQLNDKHLTYVFKNFSFTSGSEVMQYAEI